MKILCEDSSDTDSSQKKGFNVANKNIDGDTLPTQLLQDNHGGSLISHLVTRLQALTMQPGAALPHEEFRILIREKKLKKSNRGKKKTNRLKEYVVKYSKSPNTKLFSSLQTPVLV